MSTEALLTAFALPLGIAVVAIAAMLIFRTPLTNAIGRARRVGYGDKAIELGDGPAVSAGQQKEIEAPSNAGSPPNAVPASHALPPQSEVLAPIEQEMAKALADLSLPPDVERAWLLRGAAAFRVARGHEVTYRLIVGSQINVLLEANTGVPPNVDRAREIYNAAAASWPDIYRSFAFETWFHFPVNSGLLRIDPAGAGPSILRITPLGQDFLHYLVNNSLTGPKAG